MGKDYGREKSVKGGFLKEAPLDNPRKNFLSIHPFGGTNSLEGALLLRKADTIFCPGKKSTPVRKILRHSSLRLGVVDFAYRGQYSPSLKKRDYIARLTYEFELTMEIKKIGEFYF